MLNPRRQSGMSLVEMLVSLVAGLVVVASAISLFTAVIVSGNTTLMLSRLNQDVQAVTDIIARDIQRAGYDPDAVALVGSSPPSASAYTFSTEKDLWPAPSTMASCIRVKYRDTEGGTSIGRIYSHITSSRQLRVKDSSVSSALTSTDCGSGGNQLISSTEVVIDSLNFKLVPGSNPTGVRAVNISISATHARNPDLSLSLERRVRIRNDGY
ncbi:prepilin-type N-terminal cleavage/methylation domain-containing protein [Zobellella sp. DQSA1]|uniref:prepilin-type N-terminal cleavage/methylation domain-containing protein n=1 Tax=Zobellella sp. DQSA1 TaxID=3342386 RepID=UPI0035BF9A2F